MTTSAPSTPIRAFRPAFRKDFQLFLLRGNVVDLVIGVVVGVAFAAVVTALVGDAFINALIAFVLIAAVVFFFVVRPVNALMSRRRTEPPVDATTRQCRSA